MLLRVRADPDHGALDIVLVHLRHGVGHVIVLPVDLRNVLEHVLRGHLEHLMALLVHEHGLDPLVEIAVVVAGYGQHEVDNTDIGRHGHGQLLLQ